MAESQPSPNAPAVKSPKAPGSGSPSPGKGAGPVLSGNAPDITAGLEQTQKVASIAKVFFNPLTAPKVVMSLTNAGDCPCMQTTLAAFDGLGKVLLNPVKGAASVLGKQAMGDGAISTEAAAKGAAAVKGAGMALEGAGSALSGAASAAQGAAAGLSGVGAATKVAGAGVTSVGSVANVIPIAGQVICVATTATGTTMKAAGVVTQVASMTLKGAAAVTQVAAAVIKGTGKVLKATGKVAEKLAKITGKVVKPVLKVARGVKTSFKVVQRSVRVVGTPVRMAKHVAKGAGTVGKGIQQLSEGNAQAAQGNLDGALRSVKTGVRSLGSGAGKAFKGPLREAQGGLRSAKDLGAPIAQSRVGLIAQSKFARFKADAYQKVAQNLGRSPGARFFQNRSDAHRAQSRLLNRQSESMSQSGQAFMSSEEHAALRQQLTGLQPRSIFKPVSTLPGRMISGTGRSVGAKAGQLDQGLDAMDQAQEMATKGDLAGSAQSTASAAQCVIHTKADLGISRTLREAKTECSRTRQTLRNQPALRKAPRLA